MKTIITICLSILLCTSASAQWQIVDFKGLGKIEGNWEMNKEDIRIQESWIKKNDTLFEGHSYTTKDGRKISEENIQLVYTQNKILYIPTVKNQNDAQPISFTLISKDGNNYVFENKDHDFPQRITYHFIGRTHIDASISGNTPKGFKQIDFQYKRTDKK